MAGARLALGLIVPAALVIAGAGPALAASGSAAAGGATSSCSVTWVGLATSPLWTIGKNWSTGKVPGPASNVCITSTGVDVLTPVSIKINSLLLGEEEGIALEGSAAKPVTATIATTITLTPGEISRIDMTDATINAAEINDQGGTIFTNLTCDLNSPDVIFGRGGSLQAGNGTTTLASLPQLSNGTLTGATFNTETNDSTIVVPGDITSLVSSSVNVSAGSAILDPQGHNALTGLTSVDAQSSFADGNTLVLTGSSFTASGNVSFAGGTVAIGGPYTQAGGTLAVDGGVLSASPITIDSRAALDGSGTITGNVVNDGSTVAGENLQVKGSYTQAAKASLTSGFGSLLAVTGQATLAGEALSAGEGVDLGEPGDTSPVITFGSLSGNFTSHMLGQRLFTQQGDIEAVLIPQIAASATTVAPGGTLTVSGASFTLGESIRLYLDHASGTPLGTATAGYGGRFTVTVVIPASATAGPHRLIAVGSDGDRASIPITAS